MGTRLGNILMLSQFPGPPRSPSFCNTACTKHLGRNLGMKSTCNKWSGGQWNTVEIHPYFLITQHKCSWPLGILKHHIIIDCNIYNAHTKHLCIKIQPECIVNHFSDLWLFQAINIKHSSPFPESPVVTTTSCGVPSPSRKLHTCDQTNEVTYYDDWPY